VIGFVAVLGLLGSLHVAVGLGVLAVVVGLTCGAVLTLLLTRGLVVRGDPRLGPADRVTLTRAVLACGVAALTTDGFDRPTPLGVLVALSVAALAMDAVDGWVARRTGTSCPLGARFDMEADAFLILVLSVHVTREVGWWVLVGGVARYVLLAATRWAPWLRRELPARRWRKLVAGLQGVVLTVAAAQLLAPFWTEMVLLAALALLAASFGTQVGSLWRRRAREGDRVEEPAGWPVVVPLDAVPVRGVP
jgi:phosphatidylglycerophosphate synthase